MFIGLNFLLMISCSFPNPNHQMTNVDFAINVLEPPDQLIPHQLCIHGNAMSHGVLEPMTLLLWDLQKRTHNGKRKWKVGLGLIDLRQYGKGQGVW